MESVNSRMTKVNQQYDYNTIYLIILKRLHVLIRTLYAEGYDTFLSGMADGFDICGAQAVMELQSELPGLRLIAVPAYLKNITNDTFYLRMYAEVMASAALITQLVLIIPETVSINVTKYWSPTAPPSYVTTMGLKAAQQIQ